MNILMEQLFRTDLRKRRAIMKFVPNESVLRVALTVFSVCFGILSISLLVLGVVYINELQWPKSFVALDFLELPTLIIILGAVSLLLSFAGCFCAKSYSRPYYFLFALTLCVVLCLELTIAIIAFNNNTETRRSSTKFLMESQILFNNNTAALEMIEKRVS